MTKFTDMDLIDPIQKALKEVGYETPTPIQEQTIPLVLNGHDVLGIAQTGTGKTAAFCLPILNLLQGNRVRREPKRPRTLILTPTRELAIQIHDNLNGYGRLLRQRYEVIFGGVGQGKQVQGLKQGADVLVATPGRLLDLIQQRHLFLDKIEIFVLDEADRMLDMGFFQDIKKIIPLLPKRRHNLFFSATMPKEIQSLANKILVDPKKVEVTPPATTVDLIQQSVMYVEKKKKMNLLVHLLKDKKFKRTLVFVEMKHMANKVVDKLAINQIKASAIHGNKTQGARQRAIQDFSSGKVNVLVATDIASRGIDIDNITHVVNFDLPNVAESYVHRIGRTARAGTEGSAISLVTGEEKSYLVNIEKTTHQNIAVDTDQPYHSEEDANAKVLKVGKAKAMIEGQRRKGGGRRRPYSAKASSGGDGRTKVKRSSRGGPKSQASETSSARPSQGPKRPFSRSRNKSST